MYLHPRIVSQIAPARRHAATVIVMVHYLDHFLPGQMQLAASRPTRAAVAEFAYVNHLGGLQRAKIISNEQVVEQHGVVGLPFVFLRAHRKHFAHPLQKNVHAFNVAPFAIAWFAAPIVPEGARKTIIGVLERRARQVWDQRCSARSASEWKGATEFSSRVGIVVPQVISIAVQMMW